MVFSVIMQVVPPPPLAVLASAAPDPQTARRLWALTVRSERALRATAPLWPAQRAAWGDTAHILDNIANPASWLSQPGAVLLLPASATAPLARLLVSCAATELKAARVAGLQPDSWVFRSLDTIIFRDPRRAALSPTVVSLLLPRLASFVPTGRQPFACNALQFLAQAISEAVCGDSLTSLMVLTSFHMSVLLSRSVAEAAVSPATGQEACWAMMSLVSFTITAAHASLHVVQKGRWRLSADVRARLAQPILMLLRSPLLGRLSSLQHVVVASNESLWTWQFPDGYNVPPVHLLPARMQPDRMDSSLAMQVGRIPCRLSLDVFLLLARR